MPLQSTSGAASYDAFGGGAAAKVNYIEDFFQSYLRTGTGASATVTTGLDGSTKETLVWTKSRSAATNHKLTNNVRGATNALSSNTTGAEATDSQGLTAFSSTGYTIGTNTDYNNSGATYVDWQWVAQPKFFDVVTYTGNGVAGRQLSHSLGSVPGCIIVKETGAAGDWRVWHRGLPAISGSSQYQSGLQLNTTVVNGNYNYLSGDPTSTYIPLTSGTINSSGSTYVMYLYAHDAGGFGLTGTDNVISCGSYTTNVSGNATVNLGWEPQWFLRKKTNGVDNWRIADNMRGWTTLGVSGDGSGNQNVLFPNLVNTESSASTVEGITSTGFGCLGLGTGNETFIYIAIRRGPMKVPTTGTSVFQPVVFAGNNTDNRTINTNKNFVTDWLMTWDRTSGAFSASSNFSAPFITRMTGFNVNPPYLTSTSTAAQVSSVTYFNQSGNNSQFNYTVGASAGNLNSTGQNYIHWNFGRATGFFDVVCYTGTAGNLTISHNLQKIPELIIFKRRNSTGNWWVWHKDFTTYPEYHLFLNTTGALATGQYLTDVTSSDFSLANAITADVNASGGIYATYLFATCAGVSKVGSYTGNGSSQTINCGFTGGARFVMIKRTNASGDWYVWDTARGIVSGNDPRLSLNSTAAEVTTDDSVDTDSTGFVVNQLAATNVNVNAATYIFLAIA